MTVLRAALFKRLSTLEDGTCEGFLASMRPNMIIKRGEALASPTAIFTYVISLSRTLLLAGIGLRLLITIIHFGVPFFRQSVSKLLGLNLI